MTLALITSTRVLPNGRYEMELYPSNVWREARKMGLIESEYGRFWFVYASRKDYEDSLD